MAFRFFMKSRSLAPFPPADRQRYPAQTELSRTLNGHTQTRLASTLRSAPWFVASFISTAIVCLMFYSGGHSPILPLLGESVASLHPDTLYTPIWAVLFYLIARIVLRNWLTGKHPFAAMISGSVSFLLIAVVYDQHIVPYLAVLMGRTEFEQDTWFNFYLAVIVCTTVALMIECSIMQIATSKRTKAA